MTIIQILNSKYCLSTMMITIRMKLTLKQQLNHNNLKNQVKASNQENQEKLDDNYRVGLFDISDFLFDNFCLNYLLKYFFIFNY